MSIRSILTLQDGGKDGESTLVLAVAAARHFGAHSSLLRMCEQESHLQGATFGRFGQETGCIRGIWTRFSADRHFVT